MKSIETLIQDKLNKRWDGYIRLKERNAKNDAYLARLKRTSSSGLLGLTGFDPAIPPELAAHEKYIQYKRKTKNLRDKLKDLRDPQPEEEEVKFIPREVFESTCDLSNLEKVDIEKYEMRVEEISKKAEQILSEKESGIKFFFTLKAKDFLKNFYINIKSIEKNMGSPLEGMSEVVFLHYLSMMTHYEYYLKKPFDPEIMNFFYNSYRMQEDSIVKKYRYSNKLDVLNYDPFLFLLESFSSEVGNRFTEVLYFVSHELYPNKVFPEINDLDMHMLQNYLEDISYVDINTLYHKKDLLHYKDKQLANDARSNVPYMLSYIGKFSVLLSSIREGIYSNEQIMEIWKIMGDYLIPAAERYSTYTMENLPIHRSMYSYLLGLYQNLQNAIHNPNEYKILDQLRQTPDIKSHEILDQLRIFDVTDLLPTLTNNDLETKEKKHENYYQKVSNAILGIIRHPALLSINDLAGNFIHLKNKPYSIYNLFLNMVDQYYLGGFKGKWEKLKDGEKQIAARIKSTTSIKSKLKRELPKIIENLGLDSTTDLNKILEMLGDSSNEKKEELISEIRKQVPDIFGIKIYAPLSSIERIVKAYLAQESTINMPRAPHVTLQFITETDKYDKERYTQVHKFGELIRMKLEEINWNEPFSVLGRKELLNLRKSLGKEKMYIGITFFIYKTIKVNNNKYIQIPVEVKLEPSEAKDMHWELRTYYK